MSWNDEKVNKLKELWGKGSTASQIAEIIGGISRNAVIGKAHRLNLSTKIKTRNASSSQNFDSNSGVNNSKQKQGKKSRFQSLIIEKDFEPENPKKLEELDEGSCKWPVGHPEEKSFYFCGRSSLKDFSYCKLHLLYAYQPKGRKEEPTTDKEEEVSQYTEKKTNTA
jgi:GcrA cell cycle regulator|tara:strand:+ start:34 stop:534 length:501 start_codon:yes stop_codon:yes gene_type:complete